MSINKMVVGCLLAGAISTTQAASIVIQLPDESGFNFGTLSSIDPPVGSAPRVGQQIGESFSINSAYNVTGLTWWGAYNAPTVVSPDDFTVRIFDFDSNNDPSQLPSVLDLEVDNLNLTRTELVSQDFFGSQMYQYSLDLGTAAPGLQLVPGNYLISVLNYADPNINSDWQEWYWADADFVQNLDGVNWGRTQDGTPWLEGSDFFDLAFALEGTEVPLPGAFFLMLTALGGLFSQKLLRRRTA